MSQTLQLELPDDVYEAIVRAARKLGRTPEDLAAELVKKSAPEMKSSPQADNGDAIDSLMKFAGVWDSGDPRSADNDRIDADLAREYGSSHKEEE